MKGFDKSVRQNNVIDSLRSLHDLSKTINSTLNIKEVEGMVMEKTSQLMKSGRVMILCLDREEKVLTIHRALGFDEKELRLKRFYKVQSFDHCLVHKRKRFFPKPTTGRLLNQCPFCQTWSLHR